MADRDDPPAGGESGGPADDTERTPPVEGAEPERRRGSDPSQEPELEIGPLLSAGVDGLASATGAQLVALLATLGVASRVSFQTVLAEYVVIARDQGLDPELVRTLEDLGPFPLALDLPVGAAALALLVLPLVAEAVRIVAVRAFAEGSLGGLGTARVWPNITKATVLGFLGGSGLLLATSFGAALLIAPGIFIAVTMVFFRQEIAVADKGIVGSLRGSWSLTEGNRWDLLGLLVVLAAIGLGTTAVTFLLPPASVVAPVAGAALRAVAVVFSAAVVTEAYVTLREGRSTVPMSPEEIDQTQWRGDEEW